MNHEQCQFVESTIQLDGDRFFECTFTRCLLLFGGGQLPVIEGCLLDDCRFDLNGAALLTANFLATLYHAGDDFSHVAEQIFEKIRQGEEPYLRRTLSGRFLGGVQGDPFMGMAHDDEGNPVDILEAVFPIFQDQGQSSPWLLLGTGFFVSNFGVFATARHVVIDEKTKQVRGSLWGVNMIRRSGMMVLRRLLHVDAHSTSDVAIGLLEGAFDGEVGTPALNPHLILTRELPPVGETIATVAFPRPRMLVEEGPKAFRIQYAPEARRGEVTAYFPNGRDKTLLPGPCFETNVDLRGHASGGPVFFGRGAVFAVNSTGLEEERNADSPPPVSYVSSVEDLFLLRIKEFWTPDGTRWGEMSLGEMAERGLLRVA